MTQPYSDSPDQIGLYPDRKALRNFTWTDEAINEWEDIWHDLWWLGYKWEWQNSDRYARRYGDTFRRFGVHNDALRLDMAIPLPGVEVIHQILENILDCSDDDQRYDHLVGKLSRWFDKHEAST